MKVKKMTAEDKKWQAENDARSLATAKEIKADKKRLAAALKAAQKLSADAQKEAQKYTAVEKSNKKIMRK